MILKKMAAEKKKRPPIMLSIVIAGTEIQESLGRGCSLDARSFSFTQRCRRSMSVLFIVE
jgi:hypothetical protein